MKPPAIAKGRLRATTAGQMTSIMTAALATAFLQDVIGASQRAGGVDRILVVSPDPSVAMIAERSAADFLLEGLHRAGRDQGPTSGSLNGALDEAISIVRKTRPHASIVIVTGDLAALRADTLTDVINASSTPPRTCFVADQHGAGTSILALPHGAFIKPQFGPDSAAAHLAEGAVNISDQISDDARIDIDTLRDLEAALAHGIGPHTAAVLAALANTEGGPSIVDDPPSAR